MPRTNDNIDRALETYVVLACGGCPKPPIEEPDEMPANMDYWQERLYKSADNYDTDAKFFENALKSSHLEGKMSAREMTFAKGGGLPTVMPLPANQNVSPVPGP